MKRVYYKITFRPFKTLPKCYTHVERTLEKAKKEIQFLKSDGCEIVSFHKETIEELPIPPLPSSVVDTN